MKKYLFVIVSITFFLFSCTNPLKQNKKKETVHFRKLTAIEKSNYHTQAKKNFDTILGNNFSGGILVAKNGEIIFEAYNGFYNLEKQERLTEHSPIHLASVSKTFTAVAVLKLVQENKIKLTDSIQQYFPNFPYHNINIQLLLSHRSGLANYLYFMDTAWKKPTLITNKDVLEYLINKQPEPYSLPNKTFHYCNTNFVILASIIEKVTQQSFPSFMKEEIFIPLAMKNTFVFSAADSLKYVPSYGFNNQPYLMDQFDGVYGDKNIYSTVRDMLAWDLALYNPSFIDQTILAKAFIPYSNEKPGKKNYGLGFRLFIDEKDTTIYHNGWWHGNNTVFTRLLKDTATIITLGNKYNRSIYKSRILNTIFSKKKFDEELDE